MKRMYRPTLGEAPRVDALAESDVDGRHGRRRARCRWFHSGGARALVDEATGSKPGGVARLRSTGPAAGPNTKRTGPAPPPLATSQAVISIGAARRGLQAARREEHTPIG